MFASGFLFFKKISLASRSDSLYTGIRICKKRSDVQCPVQEEGHDQWGQEVCTVGQDLLTHQDLVQDPICTVWELHHLPLVRPFARFGVPLCGAVQIIRVWGALDVQPCWSWSQLLLLSVSLHCPSCSKGCLTNRPSFPLTI